MILEKVVPFGRSLDEYRKMFALSGDDLDKDIVGVADGPASFNAEMFGRGRSVLSIDPLYAFRGEAIERQFYAVLDDIMAQMRSSPDDWVWSYHRSPEQLRENRVEVMRRFAADYEKGKAAGRYRVGALPALGVADKKFHLALCSHFLFLYSDHYSYAFHREAVVEMLRVASEVRIFPLLNLALKKSPYLRPLIDELRSAGFVVKVEKVGYELQKGGNEMLCIRQAGGTRVMAAAAAG